MKTVLHLIETAEPGGAERTLVNLADHLSRGEYHSLACLLEDGWLGEQLRQRGVETIVMPQAGTIDLRWVAKMATFVRQRRVDIMHAHEFAMNTYASIVSACTGVPLVATVHGKNYYTERWRRRTYVRFCRARQVWTPAGSS